MSASRPSLQQCMHYALGCLIMILVVLPGLTTGKAFNCSHPMVPEHGGFRCEPSPCRGFLLKSTIHYFCEPGFILPGRGHSSHCHNGKWIPSVPTCIPDPRGSTNTGDREAQTLPSVATTAIGVSIFLLTTTACMVIKSRIYPCHSHSRRSSDQMDLMVDGLPVSLPTYEEAVYGSWGQPLPPCQGPTQLLLSQEATGLHLPSPQVQLETGSSCQSPNLPPPPYEEIQSCPRGSQIEGDGRALQIALSLDKDN